MRVEAAADIVAKKLWYRGDQATAHDLFDLSLVIEREPVALVAAAPYLLRAHFEAIDPLRYRPGYDERLNGPASS